MLKAVLVAAALLASADSALATSCRNGTDKVLRLNDWSVVTDRLGPTVTMSFTNTAGKPLKTIRAMVRFYNAADEDLGYSNIGIDLNAATDQTMSQSARGSVRLERLPQVPREEVSAMICVTDVTYGDGTVERFK